MIFYLKWNIMRLVSFTFDDGLINTARIVKKLNIPATFYLVTGWIDRSVEIKDMYNLSLDHGQWNEWVDLGFDYGSHTHDHSKTFDEKIAFYEFKKLKTSPYNFATPYGINYEPKYFDSCKLGFSCFYNHLDRKILNKISSVNPLWDFQNHQLEFFSYIKNAPDNSWIVFTFHGIDEGWQPITKNYLIKIYDFVVDNNFEVVSISKVVNELNNGCNNI